MRALLLTIGADALPETTPVVPVAGTWVPALYDPPEPYGPELRIEAGLVIVNCEHGEFELELTENAAIAEDGFINVPPAGSILITVINKGAFTFGLPSRCVPMTGIPFSMPPGDGAEVIIGLTWTTAGETMRYVVQGQTDPTGGGGGGGGGGVDPFTVSIAPSPASHTSDTNGTAPSAPSVQVVATPANAIGAVTYAWTYAGTGASQFAISNAAVANPTLSRPSGTTALAAVTEPWRCTATDAATGLQAQSVVDVTLERTLTPPAAAVALGSLSASAVAAAPANASVAVSYRSDGMIEQIGGFGAGVVGQWLNSGAAGDFQIVFDELTGDAPTGVSLGVPLNLGTSRTPALAATSDVGEVRSNSMRVRIQRVSTGTTEATGSLSEYAETSP